jgi:hypothetical protein
MLSKSVTGGGMIPAGIRIGQPGYFDWNRSWRCRERSSCCLAVAAPHGEALVLLVVDKVWVDEQLLPSCEARHRPKSIRSTADWSVTGAFMVMSWIGSGRRMLASISTAQTTPSSRVVVRSPGVVDHAARGAKVFLGPSLDVRRGDEPGAGAGRAGRRCRCP